MIGKSLGTKYEKTDDHEFTLEIPKDEIIVGFKVTKHTGQDNKIGRIAFKTIKYLTNGDFHKYEKNPKKEFKWQYPLCD